MAEEPVEGKKKSSFIMNAVLFSAALLVPAIIGLVVFKMWLLPTLSGPPPEELVVEVVDDAFPIGMTDVVFEEIQVSVQSDDPDVVPPLLVVKVAFSCATPEAAAKVTEKKSYFEAEILKYHQGRTRSELNDPMVQNSILEQIKQQSNILLKKMDPMVEMTVLRVMHLKYMIVDL